MRGSSTVCFAVSNVMGPLSVLQASSASEGEAKEVASSGASSGEPFVEEVIHKPFKKGDSAAQI